MRISLAVLRTDTARPTNAAGTLWRLQSSTMRQVLTTAAYTPHPAGKTCWRKR
jgi:hypothetical protein